MMMSQPLPNIFDLIESLEIPDQNSHSDSAQLKILRKILKYYGYYQGTITEIFNTQTKTAICHLQKDLGLRITGQLDEATWYGIQFWLPSEKQTQIDKKSERAESQHFDLNYLNP